MKGLMIALGKGTADSGSEPDMEKAGPEGPEHEYAREAYAALKDDDEEGFVQAFLGAVRCCSKSEPEEDEEA